jgi:hypothetical protein
MTRDYPKSPPGTIKPPTTIAPDPPEPPDPNRPDPDTLWDRFKGWQKKQNQPPPKK